jgi:hypothetical protein
VTGEKGDLVNETGPAEAPPFLRVVRGEPTAEETAALVAALMAARARRSAAAGRRGRSLWADRSRLVRRPTAPGPGAWRASAFPQ